jgi:hypothetical protein
VDDECSELGCRPSELDGGRGVRSVVPRCNNRPRELIPVPGQIAVVNVEISVKSSTCTVQSLFSNLTSLAMRSTSRLLSSAQKYPYRAPELQVDHLVVGGGEWFHAAPTSA